MSETLRSLMLYWNGERDARKHELSADPEQYAIDNINAMTNFELVEALSLALEKLTNDF